MKIKIIKIVLPVLLAIALCAVPAAFAAEHGTAEATAAGGQALHAVEGGHGSSSGEMAVAPEKGENTAVEHAAGEQHEALITPAKLKDFFWLTMNFFGLVIVLVKFLAKPIGSALTGRIKDIKEELENLKAKRDEAERSYKEFESRLAGMEKEMEGIVEKAVALAETEKKRILEEAEKAAADIKRQAEAAVHAELVDAKRKLRDEVAEQAAAMAEELIVKNLTPADQVAITEQYLERVGAVQ